MMAVERPSKLQVRLDDARETLRVLPERYQEAASLGYALPGQQAGEARRSGKPVSAMPRGADVQLRAALVECGRGLADAHQACARLDWPQPVWTPTTLGKCSREPFCHVRPGVDDWDATVVCRMQFRWTPDPDDLLVSPLPSVDAVCSQLRGMLASFGLVRLSKVQRDVGLEVLRGVDRAVAALQRVKAWEFPKDALQRRCDVCGYRLPEPDRRSCQDCRKAKRKAAA